MKISHLDRPLHIVSHAQLRHHMCAAHCLCNRQVKAHQPFLRCPPPQPPGYDHDVLQWKCSHQQRIWMKTEL
ncbi:hypothetical protein PHYPO_G00204010 [Pangasianodon hypophthalmus]|uniref:Uncharacterized protein n=1 Tax=Pangasianodon hypophthalmus TaxID=310915 RepID=A0A5N5PB81_PANHP|nr:hypothetical protein PHYPO_G00204010 [Pangasianodon hypophthalmus]